MSGAARSFYFFDFDKNIMRVSVDLVLLDADGGRHEMTPAEYAKIKDRIGKPGEYAGWSDSSLFANYRDLPDTPASDQPFVHQIRSTIDSLPADRWQAPAWGIFQYVCRSGSPFSLITARGHADDTVRAGFQVLVDAGQIAALPDFLTIYNVTYPPTAVDLARDLGVELRPDGTARKGVTVPSTQEFKRVAIRRSVAAAVDRYGAEPAHHFGMSDDTMVNVEFIADAMRECKEAYPAMRFFVISTNTRHLLKAEIFPINVPVAGHGDPDGEEPLKSHLHRPPGRP